MERRVERAGHNMRLLRTVLLNTSRATFRQNLGFERVLPDEVETKEREAIIEFFKMNKESGDVRLDLILDWSTFIQQTVSCR